MANADWLTCDDVMPDVAGADWLVVHLNIALCKLRL